MALMGMGVDGKTVGLVGMGKVAEHMVPRLRPFGMDILYTKRTRLDERQERELGIRWTERLDDLLAQSDYVCLACDYNQSTHELIGRRELDLMKPTSFLINTARGRIVDQAELVDALKERRIAGAGLDVFWDEPPHVAEPFVPDELCKLDNVILAPHNGGATWKVRTDRTVSVAQSLVALMKGERPATLLNPEIFKS
jgi:glyoxylate reductase